MRDGQRGVDRFQDAVDGIQLLHQILALGLQLSNVFHQLLP